MTATDIRWLTTREAEELARQGHANNPVSGSTRTTARILRTTVFSFYNNVLFVIGIALLGLGRYSDALVSVGLGLINAALSAFQELRARRALNRLQLLAREPVVVVRDGTDRLVSPTEVVRGDLIKVRAGDQIVADGPVEAVTAVGGLEVDESLLTGESEPVPKAEGDALLSGSSCPVGEALQRADAVGADSHAGRLTLAARADTVDRTPLQWRIDLVVRLIIALVVLMSGAILAQALLDGSTTLRFVQTSAVLSGLVPYGLFFLIAVAYAVGATRIAKRGVLVQQTNAIEAISRVDVVCTDKTGTLTSGRLALVEVIAPAGPDVSQDGLALARRLLGTFARSVSSTNATTAALAADDDLPGGSAALGDEVEFRSSQGWSGMVLAGFEVGSPRSLVLGAPDVLRGALSPGAGESGWPIVDGDAAGDALEWNVRALTARGLRVLLFAGSDESLRDPDGAARLPALQPIALVALSDELRPGVTDVLDGLAADGVAVKVISGDDPDTVAALARRAGITGPAIAGPRLAGFDPPGGDERADGAGTGAQEFDQVVDTHAVFGRIVPEQKEQIVESLRRRGSQVAMLGDGVNDARALKRAQVGVAMRAGSPVTRDVADIVLLDNDFASLPPTRTEGRRIVTGVSLSMFLFLDRVVTQMLVILTVTLLGLGFPYTPTQVGLTLFSVGIPTLFLTMWARPNPPREDLLVALARFVIPVGVITAGFGAAIYAFLYTLVSSGLSDPRVPDNLVTLFEQYTGLVYGHDADFVEASATLLAQSGLSVFTSVTAILLILFLAPPARLFTAWTAVSADRRPMWLALALIVALVAVLLIPATRNYFGLTAPDPPVLWTVGPAVGLWFTVLSLTLRHHLLERLLGLPGGAAAPAEAPSAPREAVTSSRPGLGGERRDVAGPG